MAKLKPIQLEISTGTTDNDTVTTKGYVDEHSANAIWTLIGTEIALTTPSNTIEPATPLKYTSHPTFTLDEDIVDKRYVDDIVSFYAVQEPLTVATPGQTIFTLSEEASGTASFGLFLNGQLRNDPIDYQIAGTTLTWNDPAGLTLKTTDVLTAWYDYSGVLPTVSPIFIAVLDSDATAVTGAGTFNSIVFDLVNVNRGNKYSVSTGKFSPGLAGTYSFSYRIILSNMRSANNNLEIGIQEAISTKVTWLSFYNPSQVFAGAADEIYLTDTVDVQLSATDEILFVLRISGNPSDNVIVKRESSFSGYLLGI